MFTVGCRRLRRLPHPGRRSARSAAPWWRSPRRGTAARTAARTVVVAEALHRRRPHLGPAGGGRRRRHDTHGNPSPVVDPRTGRIVLLTCYQRRRRHRGARSWRPGRPQRRPPGVGAAQHRRRPHLQPARARSPPTTKHPDWRWYATGPGHAIALTTGPAPRAGWSRRPTHSTSPPPAPPTSAPRPSTTAATACSATTAAPPGGSASSTGELLPTAARGSAGGVPATQVASWKTRPRVCRRPLRTTDTPCRTGAADQPRLERTGRSRVVKTSPCPCGTRVDGAARLRPGTLLDEQELPARVVLARRVEVDHDLERKDLLAEQVAVQGVPAAALVAQQDRRRAGLPGLVADLQPLVQACRATRRPGRAWRTSRGRWAAAAGTAPGAAAAPARGTARRSSGTPPRRSGGAGHVDGGTEQLGLGRTGRPEPRTPPA